MSIGANWAEIWAPVWKQVWTQEAPEPEPEPTPPPDATGGWFFSYEAELAKRRRAKQRRRELEEETEQIADPIDREIATFIRRQEAKDERKAELNRLKDLAKSQRNLEAVSQYNPKVAEAMRAAVEKGTTAALDRLDRELRKARDEESFMSLALMLLLD